MYYNKLNHLWKSHNIGEDYSISLDHDKEIKIEYDKNLLIINIYENKQHKEQLRFVIPLVGNISIKPSFPDRPIVIRSKNKLSILAGQKFEAYIEVPLILTVVYQDNKHDDTLFELPLGTLSRSFFGNSENGEIAYSLESPLNKRLEEYNITGLNGYCPISIINKSNSKMDFERMILRVPNLSIYQYPDYLLGSPVHVIYTGLDQGNQTIIRKTAPNVKIQASKVYPPRQVIDNNLLRKSFYFLKTVYNG